MMNETPEKDLPTFESLRKRTGLWPRAFAKRAGVSYDTIHRLEDASYKGSVTDEYRYKVVRALNELLGTNLELEDIQWPK